MTGVDLIAAERRRQVEVEGYTAAGDVGGEDELALAASVDGAAARVDGRMEDRTREPRRPTEERMTWITSEQATDLTHQYDDTHWFPFVEDENANITGPGHQDTAAFARAVDHFGEVCTGETYEVPVITAAMVTHRWVVMPKVTADEPEGLIRWEGVTASTPGAIPVTTIWGAR